MLSFSNISDMHLDGAPPQCEARHVVAPRRGGIDVEGLFTIPHAGPSLKAMVTRDRDLLTLTISTTGFGALAITDDRCYTANISGLEAGRYHLLIVHLVHSVLEGTVRSHQVLDTTAVAR